MGEAEKKKGTPYSLKDLLSTEGLHFRVEDNGVVRVSSSQEHGLQHPFPILMPHVVLSCEFCILIHYFCSLFHRRCHILEQSILVWLEEEVF